ncbi:two-component system OmpR family response regulator [Sphingobium sp. B2D3A]|uniref:response regulator transcription factor n=1 Tax=unclassified Sphingobium TaxID=2611147 RepID=UPI0022259C96|nr:MULTISPECIES: response regulator transcription factor [unclassified Sphingobium]MCW2337174.1 two-component system OmpR family response regulator [Sphingobium sp. B2D3A]MCW2383632.1 two-component system OmpR family response regulator [Sphingobium sp. B2D3D]
MNDSGERKHVVVLDDDAELRTLICEYLEAHELRVSAVGSGAELRLLLGTDRPDAIILDVMMPVEDGLSVLKDIAGKADRPAILMLSAMASDVDRILGLELGADDYIAKPVNPRELLARVRAVLRRRTAGRGPEEEEVEAIRFDGWVALPASYGLVSPGGTTVELTTNEYRLLLALLRRPGRVVSRDTLMFDVHGADAEFYDRAVDVGISRLRAKLAEHDASELIRTVRGEGYLLVRRS